MCCREVAALRRARGDGGGGVCCAWREGGGGRGGIICGASRRGAAGRGSRARAGDRRARPSGSASFREVAVPATPHAPIRPPPFPPSPPHLYGGGQVGGRGERPAPFTPRGLPADAAAATRGSPGGAPVWGLLRARPSAPPRGAGRTASAPAEAVCPLRVGVRDLPSCRAPWRWGLRGGGLLWHGWPLLEAAE